MHLSRSRRSAVALFTAFALMSPAVARGQTAAEAQALSLYVEGKALYAKGQAVEAEAKFQAAWDLKRGFDVAGNLGTVELYLKQYRDAAEHLSYALKNFPVGTSPEQRPVLEGKLAEAKARVGAVNLSVTGGEADVLVDGKSVGKAPLQDALYLEPGDHALEARRGTETANATVHTQAGKSEAVTLQLGGDPTTGIGGKGPNPAVLATGGALAGVGVALGVVFLVVSNGKASKAEDVVKSGDARRCPVGGVGAQGACAELRSDLQGKATFANASLWSFIGGGAAASATVLYWALSPRARASETGLRAAPLVSPNGAGLSVSGTW